MKLAFYIRVDEGNASVTPPTPLTNHYHIPLANLKRLQDNSNITQEMISIIFDKRLPQDLFQYLGLQRRILSNTVLGSVNSFAITSGGNDDNVQITDLVSGEFLYIDGKLIPSGFLNNTQVDFTSAEDTGFYNLVLKLQSSDLSLNFIKKPLEDGVADDEFLICECHWNKSDEHVRASYKNFLVEYGDGNKTKFSLGRVDYVSSLTKAYVNGILVNPQPSFGDGNGDNGEDSFTFVSPVTRGHSLTLEAVYGTGTNQIVPGFRDLRNFDLISSNVSQSSVTGKEIAHSTVRSSHVHTDYVLPPKVLGYILDKDAVVPSGFTQKLITVKDNAGSTKNQIFINGVRLIDDELKIAIPN